MNLSDAFDAFVRNLESRNLRPSSIVNYRTTLAPLCDFAKTRGITDISGIDAALLAEWRESWTFEPATQQLRIVLLKAFFAFAVDAAWIVKSPAAKPKAPKGSVRGSCGGRASCRGESTNRAGEA